MSAIQKAIDYINEKCKENKDFKKNIDVLDSINFSSYLQDGLNLQILRDRIEQDYDKIIRESYGFYALDWLDTYDIQYYFVSRYNVWFQPYMDWVVRKENGINGEVARRSENNS